MYPEQFIRGWERAVDAQTRIVEGIQDLIKQQRGVGDIAVISHGGVGALLLCSLMSVAISRDLDQPGNGAGNHYMFSAEDMTLRHGWKPIELP